MAFSVADISAFKVPWLESYFNKWASMVGEVRSLIATTSMFAVGPTSSIRRKAKRPIRPKPLIPIFTVIMLPP